MINADMRLYNYFTIGEDDGYGQAKMPTLEDVPVGQVKIAINISSQSTQENINYKDAQYIGLTRDKDMNDTYVLAYEGTLLKVLYVNPKGKLKQVFLKEL